MKFLLSAVSFSFCIICESFSLNLLNLSKTQKEILQDLSWKIRPTVLNSFLTKDSGGKRTSIFDGRILPNFRANDESDRKLGLLTQGSQDGADSSAAAVRAADCAKTNGAKEEIAMKTRMFSLMYETVRDTDTKVKRAELIKDYYANNTDFEMGFLMGEATDKYNSMMEVAATVKRLYKEWKPLDHINAYEQISNHAIDVNTVVDMIISKYHAQSNDADAPAETPARLRYKITN